jgi:hypothetical protein
MKSAIIFYVVMGFACSTFAKYDLPRNLDILGQEAMAKSLGFGSGLKMNADPIPLGGYEGFQITLSRDYIDVGALKRRGIDGGQGSYVASNSLMFGKGIFYDFDAFFQMTTPQNEELSSYGSVIRGKLYSLDSWSLVFGGLVHGSFSQLSNLFGSSVFGYDFYMFSEISKFVLFFGAGQARGIHRFIGGASGLTGEDQDLQVDLLATHIWGGISYHHERWIFSGLTEVYFEPIYSLKIGYNL